MAAVKRGLIDKVTSSLERHGVIQTVVLVFKNFWWFLRDNLSSWRRERRREAREFERRTGIDTEGIIHVAHLGIIGDARSTANMYEPSPIGALESILRSMPIDAGKFTFIDVGSGLGRAVFVALEFPFKRAVGVELSPVLHEVAQENLKKYRSPRRLCHDCDFWLGDATRYEWPNEPIVLYLYNPFGEVPMTAMLENLRNWLMNTAHELYIIYYNPIHQTLLDDCPFLENIKAERLLAVYRGKRH
jgi:SAM-dependent methyltransferase